MDKIGETTVAKNMRDGWAAKTKFALGITGAEGPRILIIETSKSSNGALVTNAGVHSDTGSSYVHAFSLGSKERGDFSKNVLQTRSMATEKAIRSQHAEALKGIAAIEAEALAHYKYIEDAKALNDRRDRELAEQDARAA